MLVGYILMVVVSCTSLAEGIMIKQYNKKYDKGGFLFTALVSVFGLLYVLISDLIKGAGLPKFSVEILPYALIAGAMYCAASIFTYIALRYGSFAITMLVLSYSLVFSILYGVIFLEEPTTLFMYLGFAVIAISIFLVRKKGDPKAPKRRFSFVWLIAMIISVVGSGFFSVISKMQQIKFNNEMDSEFMIITYAFTAITLSVIGVIIDKKDCLYILKHGTLYAGTAGLANGASNMLGLVITMLITPYSIVVPTRSAIKTVVSFLVSFFIFKEKFEKRQILGVALGLVAVLLLNLPDGVSRSVENAIKSIFV